MANLRPENVIRPKDENTVRIVGFQADAWWHQLTFEQKLALHAEAKELGIPKNNSQKENGDG